MALISHGDWLDRFGDAADASEEASARVLDTLSFRFRPDDLSSDTACADEDVPSLWLPVASFARRAAGFLRLS